MEDKKKRFTLTELKEFDGKEGKPSYIAYKGVVYNASNSPLWKEGNHQGRHSARNDLTESFVNAPHDEEVFSRLQIIGELSQEDITKKTFIQRLERVHLHAMLVHFPIAYFLVISLLVLLYLFTNKISFETASYYMLILGFLASPFAILTGLFTWKVTYKGRKIKIFARKIEFSTVLIIIVTICFLWRTINPDVLITKTAYSYFYLLLVMSLAPVVSLLGHYGGKIVYS